MIDQSPKAVERVNRQFEEMREPVATLAKSLARAVELSGEDQSVSVTAALTDFHDKVKVGLDLDSHVNLRREDFLSVVRPVQILYKLGRFVDAVTLSQKFGSDGHYISRIKAHELHSTAAKVIDNWYVGYHQENIRSTGSPRGRKMDVFASMGLADPVLEVLDGILTGKPLHSVMADIDDVQRSHLCQWKGRLVPKAVGARSSSRILNDPDGAWADLTARILRNEE